MKKVASSITAAAAKVPPSSACCGLPPSLVRTRKVPASEITMPAAASSMGSSTRLGVKSPPPTATALTPSTSVPTIAPTYDSKRSAPMPATSPTLSPTLSAITAGLRGSSSGIPASTLPTRSAPTSAALV
jgi:hypothetical protein